MVDVDPHALTQDQNRDEPPANRVHAALPKRISRYIIEARLGEGSFGLVYLALDQQLNRRVAVKVPHRNLVSRAEDAEAYLLEARTVASLDHPNIVPVYDVGSTATFPCFIVSKYVAGTTLALKMKHRRLRYGKAAELVAQIADALHYAHKQGVVHRDVKPGNIMIDAEGKPHLADFGLALREDDLGKGPRYVGTPAYMSPEQARGEGHRVDGRSDIFALGVVFYELLIDRRPFRADSRTEQLEQIIDYEPRPLRQVDDSIPKEFERICFKALAKRASERYMTAKDMADDLRHFMAEWRSAGSSFPRTREEPPASGTLAATQVADDTLCATATFESQSIKIVPKGLRSFDAHDADFFLELLPGPRDREGLPDRLRFWKNRIEETDADATFTVGVIYGPSGCGKSSLVKAGLLPRLSEDVIPVYVEADAEETEARLLNGLRKRCFRPENSLDLKDTLAALRKGQGIAATKKILIVLDQFEQWLHARNEPENTELVQALRQCNGGRLQAVVMVRDDFWMAVTRFLHALEVQLVEDGNLAAVDLFPERHAQKVLAAFGRAFGDLPDDTEKMSKEHKDFLRQAITGLAEEGKIICIRLALFAEMMKGKMWTAATLKRMGGAKGVGTAFLEETFSRSTASPAHRRHEKAVRAVLQALLPDPGTDIKGQMRAYDELLEASGYARRPKDFDELIRILDSEVRLISPTDPEGMDLGEDSATHIERNQRYYQLTHDYMVHSLREWLARKSRETLRGRAELRLLERSRLWNAKRENRYLPTLWEYLNIRILTSQKSWAQPARDMMRKARRVHGIRTTVVALALMFLSWLGYEINGRARAGAIVRSLAYAETRELEQLLKELRPYEHWSEPILAERFASAEDNSKEKLHASLALIGTDPSQIDYVFDRLLGAAPQDVSIISRLLLPYRSQLVGRLWHVVEQPAARGQRLRAATTLARFVPDDPQWHTVATDLANEFVLVPLVDSSYWIDNLEAVHSHLLQPLEEIYKNPQTGQLERELAASALANYLSDQPHRLIELLLLADNDREFQLLLEASRSHPHTTARELHSLLSEAPRDNGEPDMRNDLWQRQANAAVGLLELGRSDHVWPLLKHATNPSLRSLLVDRLARLGANVQLLLNRLDEESDVSIRRALLLAIGEFDESRMAALERQVTVDRLVSLYRKDPDPGIHSAVAWTLRQWQHGGTVQRLDAQLQQLQSRGAKKEGWYVNSESQTFIIVNGPVAFDMGEETELTETRRTIVARSFAIASCEVTLSQFQKFRRNHRHRPPAASEPNGPVTQVSWHDAAAYCNWLSEKGGIPPEQWCYAPLEGKGDVDPHTMKETTGYLDRTGYRMPTEAEWEYVCRANTTTVFAFGEPESLLDEYGWYVDNSSSHAWPVGMKKPNDLGAFDMHGNVWEWCGTLAHNVKNHAEADPPLGVFRGGAFGLRPWDVRCAVRATDQRNGRYNYLGFRLARTLP